MYGNPAWEEAKPYWDAFWNHSCLDRPGIQIWYPEPHPDIFPEDYVPVTKETKPYHRYNDPAVFLNQHFPPGSGCLGEAFRSTYLNWCGVAESQGAELDYTPSTIWVHRIPGELEDLDFSKFSLESETVKRMLAIMEWAVSKNRGELFIGFPFMGNPGDDMARLRGYDTYCVDLMENNELAMKKEMEIADMWRSVFQKVYGTLTSSAYPHQQGSCGWLPAWYDGPSLLLEFDFCALISPELFKGFIPALERRSAAVEKTIYHFDGPGAIPHLDTLLSLPFIDAIQALPGAGIPNHLDWMEIYRRVQAGGKSLYLANGVSEQEARVLLKELKPEGFMMPVHFDNRDKAFRFAEEFGVKV